ncbi:MAG: hypothetical protein V1817_00535 [Candidatus Micrarchaeota archaeon]
MGLKKMILDATALQPVLTPEAALGVLQKELKRKKQLKAEITDVKLVYTPFWIFSFDVTGAQGPAPSGKTALNAYTGEINEFVPMLVGRPIKKARSTPEGAEPEVEPTAIDASEVKASAKAKIAGQLGVSQDNVIVSAFTKYYVPFYRVWLDVANDSFEVNIDACLGAPLGAEAIPGAPKGFAEDLAGNLKLVASPAGLAEAAKNPGKLKYLMLIAIAVLVIVLLATRLGSSSGVSCSVDPSFLGSKNLVGAQELIPFELSGGRLMVQGVCLLSNPSDEPQTFSLQTKVVRKTNPIEFLASNLTSVVELPKTGSLPSQRPFELVWKGVPDGDYKFEYEKIG